MKIPSIIVLFIALVGLALLLGAALKWLWLQGATNKQSSALPSCGNCGYPARGIVSLQCPECGADLREVGIIQPGQGHGGGLLLLATLAYSVVFFILCGVLSESIDTWLPTYGNAHADIDLDAQHGAFDANVSIEVTEVSWGHYHSTSFGLSAWSLSPGANAPLQVTMDGLSPDTQIDTLELVIYHANIPSGASHRSILSIDPDTAAASWQGRDGKTHQSAGPITSQDMLDFLDAAGLDKTSPQTIADAQQLHILMEGLALRKTQFNLTGFDSYSSGAGSTYGGGPEWFWPLYTVVCILLWALGLGLYLRWYRRRI